MVGGWLVYPLQRAPDAASRDTALAVLSLLVGRAALVRDKIPAPRSSRPLIPHVRPCDCVERVPTFPFVVVVTCALFHAVAGPRGLRISSFRNVFLWFPGLQRPRPLFTLV